MQTCRTVVVNRLAFRLTDNPLYDTRDRCTKTALRNIRSFDCIILVAPRMNEGDMGAMQCAFVYQILGEHWKELYRAGCKNVRVVKGHCAALDTLRRFVSMGSRPSVVRFDCPPDPRIPLWLKEGDALSSQGSTVQRVFGATELLDWVTGKNERASASLKKYCTEHLERSVFNKALEGSVKKVASQCMERRIVCPLIEPPRPKKAKRIDLPTELKSLNKAGRERMKKEGKSYPKVPTNLFRSQLIRQAIKGATSLCKAWSKPHTSPGFGWGTSWSVMDDSKMNQSSGHCCLTTQLSPWLAVGAISPRQVWKCATAPRRGASGGIAVPQQSTIRGQLLWREAFHAIGLAGMVCRVSTANEAKSVFGDRSVQYKLLGSDPRKKLRIHKFWSDSNALGLKKHWYAYPKRAAKTLTSVINRWKSGELKDASDTNAAMHQLRRTGWIHHLQRHLVASVLTRPLTYKGGLGVRWTYGEAHFRDSLLDHDASINRCNFMWLAGVAFSAKSRSVQFAYDADSFISRRIQAC